MNPEMPSIKEIARLYKAARTNKDPNVMGLAEAAALQVAAAEAAVAEAAVFTSFGQAIAGGGK